jgi:hypothetical protein
VRQLRAILKIEKLPVGFVWIKQSTQKQKETKVNCAEHLFRGFRYTAHIKLNKYELMVGRSERERERKFLRGIRKKARSLE